jgi:hypothetical protein
MQSLLYFLQDTTENLIRAVARWTKRIATMYAVGAALILVALVALANGLAWAVIELGLPPYAAWLILAVATGGTGYGLFKVGAKKGITGSSDGIERRPGLSIRIVRAAPRRPRMAKKRPSLFGHKVAKNGRSVFGQKVVKKGRSVFDQTTSGRRGRRRRTPWTFPATPR